MTKFKHLQGCRIKLEIAENGIIYRVKHADYTPEPVVYRIRILDENGGNLSVFMTENEKVIIKDKQMGTLPDALELCEKHIDHRLNTLLGGTTTSD